VQRSRDLLLRQLRCRQQPLPGLGCDELLDECIANQCNSDGICDALETCSNCAADCVLGSPASCGNGVCETANGENCQNCAQDCGAPPGSEVLACSDNVDNDCDGLADCDDSDCSGDPLCQVPACDGDGVCEAGEDCLSCGGDCAGRLNGEPSGRFCCGDGIQQNAEGGGAICDNNF
jgi:hypothetical protein